MRQHGADDFLDHAFFDFLARDVRIMLRGNDHGFDFRRTPVNVAHRDLRFRIGPQPRQTAVSAHFRLALHQPVGVIDRERHQHVGLVASVAEHQALIAGALVEIEPLAFVHAHSTEQLR